MTYMYLVSISDFDEGILCELTSLLNRWDFTPGAEQQPYHPLLSHSSVFVVIYMFMFVLLQASTALLAPSVLR